MVNLIALAAIAVSAWKIWPVSICVSIFYTLGLVLTIRKFHQMLDHQSEQSATANEESRAAHECESDATAQESATVESGAEEAETTAATRDTPAALSFIYLLVILSLGFAGIILTFQAIPCSYTWDDYDDYSYVWTTNMNQLPEEVQKSPIPSSISQDFYGIGTMFAQLDNTLFYVGSNSTEGPSYLYAITNGSTPEAVESFRYPQWITKVSEDTICFLETSTSEDYYHEYDWGGYHYPSPMNLSCGNQQDGFRNLEFQYDYSVSHLMVFDGLLWFRQEKRDTDHWGIMSLNTSTMVNTTYSERHKVSSHNETALTSHTETCPWPETNWKRAITGFFLAALPITLASGYLWYKKGIPSSSVSLFVGIGLCAMFLSALIDPWEGGMLGLAFWFFFGGAAWMLLSACQLAINPRVRRGPLVWSLNALSLALVLVSSAAIVSYLFTDYPRGSEWFIAVLGLGAIVYLPLLFISILADSIFIFVLAWAELTLDVAVTTLKAMGYGTPAIVVVVLEFITLCVIGWLIHCHMPAWHNKLVSLLQKWIGCCCCPIDSNEDDATELLANDQGEEA